MESRLLNTLNFQVENTTDPIIWARTVCKAATHFARHGMAAEALTGICNVRNHYGANIDPEVASWLMLAEGVLHYFKANIDDAHDRFRRAYGLAIALETHSVLPVCAAWIAVVEFHNGEYIRMSAHIEEALETAKFDDHAAHARAALVLASAYHLAGSYSLARPWYEKARLRSADDGDNASLSAMLYNVASIRAANVRLDDTFGVDSTEEIHRAGLETASSRHYDHAINSHGLDFLPLLLRGLTKTLSKRYAEALEIFASIDQSKILKKMLALLFVDMAWCFANIGKLEEANTHLELTLSNLSLLTDEDDCAYTNSRISRILPLLGRAGESEPYENAANIALSRHREFQEKLLGQLAAIRIKPESRLFFSRPVE
jgi:tetratricopeptide (TPR) repeat protein